MSGALHLPPSSRQFSPNVDVEIRLIRMMMNGGAAVKHATLPRDWHQHVKRIETASQAGEPIHPSILLWPRIEHPSLFAWLRVFSWQSSVRSFGFAASRTTARRAVAFTLLAATLWLTHSTRHPNHSSPVGGNCSNDAITPNNVLLLVRCDRALAFCLDGGGQCANTGATV